MASRTQSPQSSSLNGCDSPEPVIRDRSPITIHCPECQQLGTHLGTCSWSQMRSGRVWTFQAVAIDILEERDVAV